jgi:1,2-diacylglycerol 3-alpha-glucosyltransferase
MKIAYFTATYYPTPDGVSYYLKDVKSELERRGHEVHIFSLNGDRTERNVHVPLTFPLPMYKQYSIPFNMIPVGLYKYILKQNFDIIHIHDPFFGTLGYRVARRNDIPIIATFHTDFVRMKESLHMPLKDLLFGLAWKYNLFEYKRCDTVLAPSGYAKEYLEGFGLRNVMEFPLFVDWKKVPRTNREYREFDVLYLGRLTKDKGVMKIIDVAKKTPPGIRFTICGTGPYEETLKKRIVEDGLDEKVLMRGYVDDSEKFRRLFSASLFISPSSTDTFGISVLEALMSGTPSLVQKGFPLSRYYNGEDSGIIEVDFSKPEEVAKTISDLMNNRSLLEKLGKNAERLSRENFSLESHCENLIDIYNDFIARRRV